MICRTLAASLFGLVVLSAREPLSAADAPGGDKIYDRTLKSTAWVLSPIGNKGAAATGSGTLLDAQKKLILTNYHVVGDRDEAFVVFPVFQKGSLVAERAFYLQMVENQQGLLRAKVLVRDMKHDLALLQIQKDAAIPSGIVPLKLARDSAKPGQRIHSIGNPGTSGALWVYTPGEVRQVYRKQFRAADRQGQNVFAIDARVVETSSPVNAGDSGGPVVNDQGELVAVTQGHAADAQARLVSYFIDVTEVKELLKTNKLAHLLPKAGATQVAEKTPPGESPPVKVVSDEVKAETTAASRLRLAKELAKQGKRDSARERYEDIIEQFPNTKAAREAKELLEKLGK